MHIFYLIAGQDLRYEFRTCITYKIIILMSDLVLSTPTGNQVL